SLRGDAASVAGELEALGAGPPPTARAAPRKVAPPLVASAASVAVLTILGVSALLPRSETAAPPPVPSPSPRAVAVSTPTPSRTPAPSTAKVVSSSKTFADEPPGWFKMLEADKRPASLPEGVVFGGE